MSPIIPILVLPLVMATIPLEWCGEDGSHHLVCPAHVSGEEGDQCLDRDQPCGTWCHSYWNKNKIYCQETQDCVEEFSREHFDCRNTLLFKDIHQEKGVNTV